MDNYLVKFNEAKHALEIAKSIDEVKQIRDQAEAMRAYIKQAKESLVMQNQCAEIKLRAERRAGEMLREMDVSKGRPEKMSHDATFKLDDLGINRTQSSRWQQIAQIPEDVFEEYLKKTIEEEMELTTNGVVRLAKELKYEDSDRKRWESVEQNDFPAEKMGIHCANCIDYMSHMDNESVDLTVTSPPYDQLRDYKGFDFDYREIARHLFRITRKGGVVVWVVGDATINGSESGTSFKQALWFKHIGFDLFDTMIYEKTGTSFPSAGRYTQVFEYMFVFSKGKPKTFNPIKDIPKLWEGSWGELRVRNKDGSLTTRDIDNAGKATSGRDDTGKYGYKQRTNIWRIVNGGGFGQKDEIAKNHPATFPEQLANDHIITWTNPGDLVFDPMCGSGTTLKAAKLNHRKYLGVDISPEYCSIARNRLIAITDSLFMG